MNKKDTYRNYVIWGALILFYIVFYMVRNYAWIDEIDLSANESITGSRMQPPSLVIPSEPEDTIFPKEEKVKSTKKTQQAIPHPKKKQSYTSYERPTQTNKSISINSADQDEWESLYNIGPYRADRIINFRNALGGFYSIEQVGETYAVPDSVFRQIKPYLQIDSTYKHLDINQVVYDSLYPHPYITKQMAYFIAKYRNTDTIKSKEELYEIIPEKDHERLRKLEPYLYFGIR